MSIYLNDFEDTIDYIIRKYKRLSYCMCLMSKENLNYFVVSKFNRKTIYNVTLKNYYQLDDYRNFSFQWADYIKDNRIMIFSGPCIETTEFLSTNNRIIKEIIE